MEGGGGGGRGGHLSADKCVTVTLSRTVSDKEHYTEPIVLLVIFTAEIINSL